MKVLRRLKKSAFSDTTIGKILLNSDILLENGDRFNGFANMQKPITKPVILKPDFSKVGLSHGIPHSSLVAFAKDSIISAQDIDSSMLAFYGGDRNMLSQIIEKANIFFYVLFVFYKMGQRVIIFKNEAIKNQIENTKVSGIRFENFKTPLEHFFIDLEKTFELKSQSGGPANIYVDGCFVSSYSNCLSIIILVRYNEYDENFMTIDIAKNDTVEDAIARAISSYKDDFGSYSGFGAENASNDSIIIEYVLRFVINTILFFNAAATKENTMIEVKVDDQRLKLDTTPEKKIGDKATKISFANYYYYLSNKSQKSKDIQGLLSSGKKIEKQFLVSGHYRNQPFGSKDMTEYKIIWIEPYLKGISYATEDKLKITIV